MTISLMMIYEPIALQYYQEYQYTNVTPVDLIYTSEIYVYTQFHESVLCYEFMGKMVHLRAYISQ